MENKQSSYIKSSKTDNPSDKPFFIRDTTRKPLDVSLRDRIRLMLLRKGFSQNKLADLCGVSSGTMSEVINGIWEPSASLKIKMAQNLDCDSLVLFGASEYWADYNKQMGYPNNEVGEE